MWRFVPLSGMWRSGRARQLWYAPLLAGAMGVMMARLLILANVLPVAEFARLSGGLLVSGTFCMLGCLGLQSQLQRQWPVNLIKGQERRGVVLAAQCILVALVCTVVAVIGILSGLSLAGMASSLLLVGILHGFSQQIFLIATVESRSRGDALRYSWENVVRSIGVFLFGLALAAWTRSAIWALAAETAVSILISWVLFRRSVALTSLRVFGAYRAAIRRLPRVDWMASVTLMTIAMVGFLTTNIDRWIAADRLGAHGFGIYSFAWIMLMVAQSAQAVINASLYPLLARTYASGGGRTAYRFCVQASLAVLVPGLVCAVPLCFALTWGIERWFHTYSSAANVFPFFFAVALLRMSDFWSSYLLIIGRELQLLAGNVVVLFAGIAIWFAVTRSWEALPQLQQMGLLALVLAVLGYGAAAGFAWRSRVV